MLAIVAVATGMLLIVVLGITGQASDIGGHLSDAEDTSPAGSRTSASSPEQG